MTTGRDGAGQQAEPAEDLGLLRVDRADAGEPASNTVTTENLIGTVMHTLLDVGQVRLMENLPRDVHQLVTSASPIKGLS